MSKTINLTCEQCGTVFSKPLKEHTRRTKQGHTEFFCTISCAVARGNQVSPRGNRDHTRLISDNRRDTLTPYRWFVRRAQNRIAKKGPTDLTPEYLQELWAAQAGKCPFTGWQLRLPHSTEGWRDGRHPTNASLDRVDNTQGYIRGNVRFVSVMANIARNLFTDEQVVEFASAVAAKRVLDLRGVEPRS